MEDYIIDEMVRVLRPVLKDQGRAAKLLRKYWRDKITLVWTSGNFLRAANERGLVLTVKEADKLLSDLFLFYNPQYGIKWTDLWDMIDQSGYGRKMTPKETRFFVQKDIVAVERKRW